MLLLLQIALSDLGFYRMTATDYKYVRLEEIQEHDLKTLLNKRRVREHLVEHNLFDTNSIKSWIDDKCAIDSRPGCRVRAIVSNATVVGWCGIQLESGKYEVAIVLDEGSWGIGRRIFGDIMRWAKEFGHDEVFIHFLDTRPEYKFLRKISKNVFETEMYDRKFTTYQLSVC